MEHLRKDLYRKNVKFYAFINPPETARNLYTRVKEHEAKYASKNIKSFMLKNQAREHGNNTGRNMAKVTGMAGDSLTRQV